MVEALAGGPMLARELGDVLGLDGRNLAYRLLPKLAGHGLVTRDADGRWELTAEPLAELLDAAADELGQAGAGAKAVELHREEREAYLEWRRDEAPRRIERRNAARRRAGSRHSEHHPSLLVEETTA